MLKQKIERFDKQEYEEFQKAVMAKMAQENMPFILAVYQVLEEQQRQELEQSGIKLACKSGCSLCCHQLITCTEIEFDEIVKFINQMPRTSRRKLQQRLKKIAQKWQRYYQDNKYLLRPNSLKPHKDWLGQPCPFLNDKMGICSIYPVRIIDCRTLTSTVQCQKESKGSVERFLFPCELYANNLIMDKLNESGRAFGVTPVHHWICYRQKDLNLDK